MRISLQMITGLALLALGSCRSTGPKPSADHSRGPEQKAGLAVAPTPHSRQVVYPWSVVAGGVASPLAMRAAMQEDPVVEAHYTGLNPALFRAEVLPAKRQGYVSYRIRDQIYWTRKMVTVQAGETVLSDGQFLVRGRCGNLISATPREPVAPETAEPQEPAMDQPVPGAQLVYSPPMPPDRVIETGLMENPKLRGTDKEMMSVLPPPDSQEMLPPAWTAGRTPILFGGITGGGSVGGGNGAPPTTSVPGVTPSPEIAVPNTPVVPGGTQPPPIEIAPPLVIASLLPPPETSIHPANPGVPSYYLPNSPWEHPVTPVYPPGSPPFQPYSPPPPQITYPPTDNTPPSTPPPGTPPPSGPPPFDPPRFDPPYSPPDSPPEEASIPEPGPWLLFAIGLAGLAAGTVRRKY